jgi:hypothetical protein
MEERDGKKIVRDTICNIFCVRATLRLWGSKIGTKKAAVCAGEAAVRAGGARSYRSRGRLKRALSPTTVLSRNIVSRRSQLAQTTDAI